MQNNNSNNITSVATSLGILRKLVSKKTANPQHSDSHAGPATSQNSNSDNFRLAPISELPNETGNNNRQWVLDTIFLFVLH